MSASAETITGSVAVARGRRSDRPAVAEPVPARAAGVALLGEVTGSGYRRPPALARRADGQTIQLTPLLYGLLQAMDGKLGYSELAAVLGERVGKLVTADDVRFLAEARLRPLGLLRQPDGSEPAVAKTNPLLALRLKLVVSNPGFTSRITAPFAILFRTPVVLGVLVAFLLTTWWIAFEKGLASAAHQALYKPGLLLLVFALTVLSAGFHEIGHAAACRYGGARPGAMGVGLYLVWPAFYTDVTDSYRLRRSARLRVDLGGLYFNAIFAVAILGLWAAVGWDALLLVIAAQLVQMVRQLVPIVRFDGYHVLADLTGVPDLFAHIKPTLLGLLPTRRRRAEATGLKPWARAVVTVWVLIVVPLLATLLALLVLVLPRIVATAWDSLGRQWSAFEANWAAQDVNAVGVGLLAMLTICLPIAGIAYLLARIVRSTTLKTWRATAGRPRLRAAAAIAGAALVAFLAWAWWPDGQYRPIEAERPATLVDVPRLAVAESGASPEPAVFHTAPAGNATAGAAPLEPADEESRGRWMLVLLPQDASDATAPRSGWPFPFDSPRAPRAQDNQALAVNTEDGSSVYDVAVALVWVTDGGPVDHRNEAYALASCRGCSTTAVAFQAVLVIGYAQVVTPVNAAVAVNYACEDCVTQALAVQLVATLAQPPSAETMDELTRLWGELERRIETFQLLPLDQVYADLLATRDEILAIVAREGGAPTAESAAEAVAADGVPVETTQPSTTAEGTTTTQEETTTSSEPAGAPEKETTTTTSTTSEEPSEPSEEPTTTEETPTTTTPP